MLKRIRSIFRKINSIIAFFLKLFTPFIASSITALNGVLMYLSFNLENISIDKKIFTSLDHFSGSSILLVGYILARSPHMCKYYKASCYSLILFHTYAEIYIYTKISFNWFTYISIICLLASIVFWTIFILGAKTRRLIHRFYRYGRK